MTILDNHGEAVRYAMQLSDRLCVIRGEAERLATRLEADDNRKDEFRYALVDRDLLKAAISFLRELSELS